MHHDTTTNKLRFLCQYQHINITAILLIMYKNLTIEAHQTVCEHPRIIINPQLPELLAKYQCYVFKGKYKVWYQAERPLFFFDRKNFIVKKNGIDKSNYQDCYVLDNATGETYPIYIEVPCNQCHVCRQRNVNAFVQRCKLESQCYANEPFWATLTYDNAHLPADGVSRRDIQLFLKRFRINLERAGYPNKIRYCVVGEYGHTTHRAHYHILVWNLQCRLPNDWLATLSILRSSWQNGMVRRPRIVDCKDTHTFSYTAKYMRKDCVVPKGKNPTFMLSSNRHGGLGSRKIDEFARELRRTCNTGFKWYNKFTGKTEDLVFSQYVLNRVFPSWCRSVPPLLRQAVSKYALCCAVKFKNGIDIFNRRLLDEYNKFKCFYGKHIMFPAIDLQNYSTKELSFPLEETLSECQKVMYKYFNRLDFELCRRLADKRNLFVSRLFEYAVPVDIGHRAYLARQTASRSLSLQKEYGL